MKFIYIINAILQSDFKSWLNNLNTDELTLILSIALITILSLLTLSLYKNNNIRLKTNNMLHKKNDELIILKEKAELEAREANKQLKKYTFIKIDKHLKTAISQYLSFFSSYVEESKKVEIKMHTKDSEDGLYISFDVPEGLDKATIQSWFDDYLNHLYKDKTEITINTVKGVSIEQSDILILKLKGQINHYQRQLDILKLENNYLKDNSDYFKDVITLLSSKSPQMFITTSNNEVKEQNNYSNQSQFIGSTFNQGNFNISNIDEKIFDLIKDSTISENEQEELIKAVEIIKDVSNSEKDKKKSGSLIRKFLESAASESAKEVMQFIMENGESWLKYISHL